jgi:hypothetical protein
VTLARAETTGEEEVVMTLATEHPAPDTLRLELTDGPSRKATLDGAWWPRTTKAEVEIPPLLEALGTIRGVVTHVLLDSAEWDLPHPRRLRSGPGAIRIGWFSAQPAGLVTIVTEFGRDRFDLLIVPPDTTAEAAATALNAAAAAGDGRGVTELLRTLGADPATN